MQVLCMVKDGRYSLKGGCLNRCTETYTCIYENQPDQCLSIYIIPSRCLNLQSFVRNSHHRLANFRIVLYSLYLSSGIYVYLFAAIINNITL